MVQLRISELTTRSYVVPPVTLDGSLLEKDIYIIKPTYVDKYLYVYINVCIRVCTHLCGQFFFIIRTSNRLSVHLTVKTTHKTQKHNVVWSSSYSSS